MTSIDFEIKFTLNARLEDQRIRLDYQNKNIILEKNNKQEICLVVSYRDDIDRIKLIDFSQFNPAHSPHIQIKEMSINNYAVKNFYQLLSFDMKNNRFVENKKIAQPQMIDFNGSLYLEVGANRDRFTWFPNNFSKDKPKIVFKNANLNCTDDIGCWSDKCIHEPAWQKFDFEQYVRCDHYEYIALGCSITAGTGILKKYSWPALLNQNGKNVLNFGVPGGGIDQIFLNVKELIRKKIKFSKIIILLPTPNRRLLRIPKHGYIFNHLLMVNHSEVLNHFNIFFKKQELDDIYKKSQRKLVMSDSYKRNRNIIIRLLSFLDKNSVNFYISSYNDDVYNILKACVKEQNLLPKFNEERDNSVGIDGLHPAESIHKKWIDTIKEQISY
jgi:hypothetical protein